MKVVINGKYGGFSLSKAAVLWLAEHGSELAKNKIADMDALVTTFGRERPEMGDEHYFEILTACAWANGDDGKGIFDRFSWHPYEDDLPRHDQLLVQCVEELGGRVNAPCAALKVVEIPDGIEYQIEEYDGNEWVAEKHQTWS